MIESIVLVNLVGLVVRVSKTSSLHKVHKSCIYILIVVALVESALIGIVLIPGAILILIYLGSTLLTVEVFPALEKGNLFLRRS